MEKLITFIIVLIVASGIWAAIVGGAWALWCWVLPQVYASGPANILAPGFWLFAGCWTLVAMVGRAIFGGGSK